MQARDFVIGFFRALAPSVAEGYRQPRVIRQLRQSAYAAAILAASATLSPAASFAGGASPDAALRLATAAAIQGAISTRDFPEIGLDALDAMSKAHMALLKIAESGRSGATRAWSDSEGKVSGKTALASISRIATGAAFDDGIDRSGAECVALVTAMNLGQDARHPGGMASATTLYCRQGEGAWNLVEAGSTIGTLQELRKRLASALVPPGVASIPALDANALPATERRRLSGAASISPKSPKL